MLQKFPRNIRSRKLYYWLFGTETFGQMLDTFRFSSEMNLDCANFTVFQFTSKTTAKEIHGERRTAAEFIPSKDNSKGEIIVSKDVASGPEVFNIAKDVIPSPEQIKEIWFAFNLVANYINNKNLKKAEGLTSWQNIWRQCFWFIRITHICLYLQGYAMFCLGIRSMRKTTLKKQKESL